MSTTITNSFVRQYERDVHSVFQRMGGYLRPTARMKTGVVGKSTTFQKVGKGTATTKARHGVITPMNQTHTAIECTLADFYAGDWVDKLDEAKVNIDERLAIAEGGAWALGRKVDDQIITALDTTTQTSVTITVTSDDAVLNGLLDMRKALDKNDVPNDGQRFGLLTPQMWSRAIRVDQFSSSDYVTANDLPFLKGGTFGNTFIRWMGILWQEHTGLPGVDTATADSFSYHRRSIGYATGAHAGNAAESESVKADITWHGDRYAHFVNHAMSGGAVLIDDTGVIRGTSNDTTALAAS